MTTDHDSPHSDDDDTLPFVPRALLQRFAAGVKQSPEADSTKAPNDTKPASFNRERQSDLPAKLEIRHGFEQFSQLTWGGMGVVHLGHDTTLYRDVVVKVVRDKYRGNSEISQRMMTEARITAQLQHPGVVPIYGLGELPDGTPFYVMKHVIGGNLYGLLSQRSDHRTDLGRYLKIFEQVCQTMAYAHRNKVIHRDLKPANVMVGEFGEVQVMDWGLAKRLGGDEPPFPAVTSGFAKDEDRNATETGRAVGSPEYMPPEQARGENDRLDARCDVFSLGAILFEILAKDRLRVDLKRSSCDEQSYAVDLSEVESRLKVCDVDGDLIALVRWCLANEPDERPRDASVLVRAMNDHFAAVDSRLQEADRAATAARARTEEALRTAAAERKSRRLVALVAAILLVAGVFAFSYSRSQQTRQLRLAESIRRALESATAHLTQAQAGSTERWGTALAEVSRAEGLARTLQDNLPLKRRVRELRHEIEVAQRRTAEDARLARDNETLLNELADLTRQDAPRQQARPVSENVPRIFERHGWDVANDSVDSLVADMRKRPTAVVERIIDALDFWALELPYAPTDAREKNPLRPKIEDVVARLTHDEQLASIRAAVRTSDVERRQAVLLTITKEHAPDQLPVHAALRLGLELSRAGAHEEGVQWLRALAILHPRNSLVQHWTANLLESSRPPRDAEAVPFHHAAIAANDLPVFTNQLVWNLLRQRRLDDAWHTADGLVKRRPDTVISWFVRAYVATELGRSEQAVSDYEQARRLQPESGQVANNLALELLGLGRLDEAQRTADDARRLMPDQPIVHQTFGTIRLAQGRAWDAIAAYRQAISLAPDYAAAHGNLCRALTVVGDFDDAIAAGRRAVQLAPDLLEAHENLGSALSAAGRYEEAIRVFDDVLDIAPELATAHYNRAVPLLSAGRLVESLRGCDRSVRLFEDQARAIPPDVSAVRAQVAHLVDLTPRLAAVLAGDLNPSDNAERLNLAFLCYCEKRFVSAAKLFDEAFTIDAATTEISQHRRYNAACCAALAADLQGTDAAALTDQHRSELRHQAITWLRAELDDWRRFLEEHPEPALVVRPQLRQWLFDPDLASLRDTSTIARLPQPERAAIAELWQDLAQLIRRVTPSGTP